MKGCTAKVATGATSRVWSSFAPVKALIDTRPSPPGRFSTTTGLPQRTVSLSASRRAVMSVPLAGPNGMMKRTVWVG